jgi:hypothetical protein
MTKEVVFINVSCFQQLKIYIKQNRKAEHQLLLLVWCLLWWLRLFIITAKILRLPKHTAETHGNVLVNDAKKSFKRININGQQGQDRTY